MKRLFVISGILFLIPLISVAEIEKIARPCEKGICLAWWPKLVPAKGWHQESDPSFANGVNIQVPDGFTFSNAETVIYAKASYKPRIPETTSLEMFIKDDKDEFLAHDPSVSVVEVQPLKTADGKILRSYTFLPKEKGNWEEVSYGEEGEYYLIFTISSRSHSGFLKSLTVYEQYIGQYK